MRTRFSAALLGAASAMALLVSACGSGSDDTSSASTTAVPATTASTTSSPDTGTGTDAPTTAPPGTTAPVEVTKVRLTTNDGLVQALLQNVAVDQGFFTANGLDVSLVNVASGPAGVQAVLTGDADMMMNAPDFVILAGQQGQPMKFVAANFIRATTTLVAGNNWPIPHAGSYPEEIADLKGAKIGVTARGSFVENQMRVMLIDAGLDPDKDVTFVAVGLIDTALPALQTGQIDAWVGFEPGTTIALEQMEIGVPVVDFRKSEGPARIWDINMNGFAATTEYIDAHPDVIERFVTAITAAESWMKDPANREALEAIAEQHLAVDATLIPALLDANLDTFGTEITRDKIQNSIDMMVQFGAIQEADVPSYEDIVATQFAPGN